MAKQLSTKQFFAPQTNTLSLVLPQGSVDTTNLTTATALFLLPTGTMLPFAGTVAPTGFLLCDGSAVSRTTYAALFAAIGTTWGVGDGSTTFNLPDMRRRTHVGSGGVATGTLGNTVGSTGGAETHTLAAGEMPSHQHDALDHGAGAVQTIGVNTGAAANVFGYNSTQNNTWKTGFTGSGTAHNNMQPSAVVSMIIKS